MPHDQAEKIATKILDDQKQQSKKVQEEAARLQDLCPFEGQVLWP